MFNLPFFLLLNFFVFSEQNCKQGTNFCIMCDKEGKYCKECESHLFEPDDNGGCKAAKHCHPEMHYCLECDSNTFVCQKCEEGFVPDNNGGCSNVEYCEIADNGICRLCKDNYTLIYHGNSYLECVSLDSEELLNCEEYDINGRCLKCKENYYLNSGDNKCSNTENCYISTKGLCDKCEYDFYLDKSNSSQYLCIRNDERNIFWKCFYSDDGKKCFQCFAPYYLSDNNICVKSKYCQKGELGIGKCHECKEDYYLTKDRFACVKTNNCTYGNGYNDKCEYCEDGFYLDLNNRICSSNQEDNDYKHCLLYQDNCTKCTDDYFLSENSKCSNSTNCSIVINGTCDKCKEGFYLGKLDLKCNSIENCIKSKVFNLCEECDDNFASLGYICVSTVTDENHNLKNCKVAKMNKILICSECKNNYYINETDNLCYPNDKKFLHCKRVGVKPDRNETCIECEVDYYLGDDGKCSIVDGCAQSYDSGKICLECKQGMCLHSYSNYQSCSNNSQLYKLVPANEICFRCKEIEYFEEKCQECEEGYSKTSKGYCIDDSLCDKRIEGKCIQCKQNVKPDNISYCLNDKFECLESPKGCLECHNSYDEYECSKCFNGYYLDEFKFCKLCKFGCGICTKGDNCGKCTEEGYYTKKEESYPGAYDVECGQCVEGCKLCTNEKYCEICKEGYFLNNDNKDNFMKCSKCSDNCIECLNENYCIKCEDGYKSVINKDKVICEKNQTDKTKTPI